VYPYGAGGSSVRAALRELHLPQSDDVLSIAFSDLAKAVGRICVAPGGCSGRPLTPVRTCAETLTTVTPSEPIIISASVTRRREVCRPTSTLESGNP
jgi:hypothetical protein